MSDLISRSDAIDACCRGWNNTAEDCIRNIKKLPSAEAEQVTSKLKNLCDSLLKDDSAECKEQKSKLESADAVQGEWKCMGDCGVTECDQCGWSIEEYVGDYNYCPNCGARMKGGEDE